MKRKEKWIEKRRKDEIKMNNEGNTMKGIIEEKKEEPKTKGMNERLKEDRKEGE